jgi:hypothetical protein
MILDQLLFLMLFCTVEARHAALLKYRAFHVRLTTILILYNVMDEFLILVDLCHIDILFLRIWRFLFNNIVPILDFARRFLEHDDEFIVFFQLNVAIKLCELLHTLIK